MARTPKRAVRRAKKAPLKKQPALSGADRNKIWKQRQKGEDVGPKYQPDREALQRARIEASETGKAGSYKTSEGRHWDIEYRKTKAMKAKLEYEKASGKLVDAAQVMEQIYRLARTTRDAMLNLPDRLAAIAAAEQDVGRVHAMLTAEIRTALESLSEESLLVITPPLEDDGLTAATAN